METEIRRIDISIMSVLNIIGSIYVLQNIDNIFIFSILVIVSCLIFTLLINNWYIEAKMKIKENPNDKGNTAYWFARKSILLMIIILSILLIIKIFYVATYSTM